MSEYPYVCCKCSPVAFYVRIRGKGKTYHAFCKGHHPKGLGPNWKPITREQWVAKNDQPEPELT